MLPFVAACSVAPAGVEIHDPYEPVNRQVHAFNKAFDAAVLDPAGEAASRLPPEIQTAVITFSDNAGLPNAVLNGLLQGDLEGALRNTARFALNTTLGLMGVLDPAATVGLTEVDADFGQTLAVWGFADGAYLELPGLGPSTERDAVGIVVDFMLDPFQLTGTRAPVDYLAQGPVSVGTGAQVAEIIVERGALDSAFDNVYSSADSYAQLRLFYLQNRRFELGDSDRTAPVVAPEDYYFDPYEDFQ